MSTAHWSITPSQPITVDGNYHPAAGGCLTLEARQGGTLHSCNLHALEPEALERLAGKLKDLAAVWRGARAANVSDDAPTELEETPTDPFPQRVVGGKLDI
jgi:hypothetical protein